MTGLTDPSVTTGIASRSLSKVGTLLWRCRKPSGNGWLLPDLLLAGIGRESLRRTLSSVSSYDSEDIVKKDHRLIKGLGAESQSAPGTQALFQLLVCEKKKSSQNRFLMTETWRGEALEKNFSI